MLAMTESKAPATSDILNSELIERIDINDELALFRLRPLDGEIPDFLPGQFTTIGLPKPDDQQPPPNSPRARRPGARLDRRAYSIASAPSNKEYIELFIVRVEDGKLTPRLWQLAPGDRLFMDLKIKGHFTMEDVPTGKDLVMISTGTGLAPYIAMMLHHRGTDRWRRLIIIHGVRLTRDLGYRQMLEQAAKEDESIIYLPTVTREPAESPWAGLRGRVTALLEPQAYQQHVGAPLDPGHAHVFLCGNPQMIDQCEAMLTKQGFVVKNRQHPDGNVHFERYW